MFKKDNSTVEVDKGLKLLAESSIIVLIGILLSKLFIYVYRIIIARYYGPEVYGLFALSIMLVGWFRIFSSLGLREGLLRYISLLRGKRENKKIQYIFKKSFFLLTFTSILAGILLFFFSDFIALKIFSNSDLTIFLKIFSITLPFTVLSGIYLSVIRAFEKIGWFSFIANILGNFVQLTILIFFIFLGINSISVPTSFLVGSFFIFLTAYFVSKVTLSRIYRLGKKTNTTKNKKTFKEMFSYAWPFTFYGVVMFIFYWTDSFVIGIFKTIDYVGFYNAAVPIAELLIFPFNLFGQLFFPLVTKEYSKGNMEVVKQLSQQVGKWIFMMSAPFFILIMIFSGAFINIFFGPEYLVAENALRFLSVGALFSALFGISQELLSIKGKSKLILIDMVCMAIVNVVLNFILIPLYGITGAGFATMLSVIILNILFLIQSHKHLSIIPIRKKMLKISLIILLSTILLLIIKPFVAVNLLSLILCGFFFVAVYTLLIFTTNCLDKNDWNVLRAIFKRLRSKKD